MYIFNFIYFETMALYYNKSVITWYKNVSKLAANCSAESNSNKVDKSCGAKEAIKRKISILSN